MFEQNVYKYVYNPKSCLDLYIKQPTMFDMT